MEKYVLLTPAATTASNIKIQADALERTIDSARRGMKVDPRTVAEGLLKDVKQLLKELPRAA